VKDNYQGDEIDAYRAGPRSDDARGRNTRRASDVRPATAVNVMSADVSRFAARQGQLCGMLTYSTLAMLYLFRIGMRGIPVGLLFWPAVLLHANPHRSCSRRVVEANKSPST